MIYKPKPHLLAELARQDVAEPPTGFLIDDAEYNATLALIGKGHPHESQEQIEERAAYKLIWDHYGIPKKSTERGYDLTNTKRIQEVHQSHRELTTVHLPAMQQAITKGLEDIGGLSAKQHAEQVELSSQQHSEHIEQMGKTAEALKEEIGRQGERAILRVDDMLQRAEAISQVGKEVLMYAAIWAVLMFVLMLVLTFFSVRAYAQVDCVTVQNSGVNAGVSCAPFKLNFTGCTATKSGSTYTIACSGGPGGSPGGSANQVQFNSAGTAFGGIASAHLGAVLIDQGAGNLPAFADPLVQGTQADASVTQPNPILDGGWDGTHLRALLASAAGRLSVDVNSAPTTAVTCANCSGTVTVSGTVTTTPPSNASTNVAQINAVTPLMGNGTTGTGSQRVTIASDNTAFAVNAASTLAAETTKVIGTVRLLGNAGAILDAATGAAPPANALLNAGLGSGATGGFLVGVPVGDTYKAINIATATTTLLVTGVSGRQVRINSLHMLTAGANNVALIEGTGAICGTGTAGMAGGTTTASGYNFAANGGIAFGSGQGTIMQTATTGDSVCVVTSAGVQLSGGLEYSIY